MEDAEAFVRSTLHRSGIRFEHDEFEDLVCEGLALLWQLAASYDARRGGHAQDGRFSGYAAAFLPKRLGDAWHRRHPEHIYSSRENGKRQWTYYPAPVSFDGLLEHQPERADRHARPMGDWVPVAAP